MLQPCLARVKRPTKTQRHEANHKARGTKRNGQIDIHHKDLNKYKYGFLYFFYRIKISFIPETDGDWASHGKVFFHNENLQKIKITEFRVQKLIYG